MSPQPRRAAPMSPEARRASIVEATIPLLRHHGRAVTTAQIALAAGVAEGTLFRVFPDKESLIAAAIDTAFDPSPTIDELARIDADLPLRDTLVAIIEIMQRRVEGVWQLMSMLGMTGPPAARVHTGGRCQSSRPTIDPVFDTIAQMIAPFAGELRCEPDHAARLLRVVTFAGTHPRITDGAPLTAGEIVGLFLDGTRRRDELTED